MKSLKEETISEEEDGVRTKHEQIFVLPTPRVTRADIDLMQKLADEVKPQIPGLKDYWNRWI